MTTATATAAAPVVARAPRLPVNDVEVSATLATLRALRAVVRDVLVDCTIPATAFRRSMLLDMFVALDEASLEGVAALGSRDGFRFSEALSLVEEYLAVYSLALAEGR